jgi:hypothetical protein
MPNCPGFAQDLNKNLKNYVKFPQYGWRSVLRIFYAKIWRMRIMLGNKERVNKAQDRAMESLEYVIDCREASDFVEVTGYMGGDVITYRVYDDGRMYER